MAAHGAYRLARMNKNLAVIQAVEVMCAAQGIEARAPLATSKRLQAVIDRLREDIATLGVDRYLAPDIERATLLVRSGAFVEAAQ